MSCRYHFLVRGSTSPHWTGTQLQSRRAPPACPPADATLPGHFFCMQPIPTALLRGAVKAWSRSVKSLVARSRSPRLASVAARYWCRPVRVSCTSWRLPPGPGALPRLLPRTKALALDSLFLIQAGRPALPSRMCCRQGWQLDVVCRFGEYGAFFVLPHATFTPHTVHIASQS